MAKFGPKKLLKKLKTKILNLKNKRTKINQRQFAMLPEDNDVDTEDHIETIPSVDLQPSFANQVLGALLEDHSQTPAVDTSSPITADIGTVQSSEPLNLTDENVWALLDRQFSQQQAADCSNDHYDEFESNFASLTPSQSYRWMGPLEKLLDAEDIPCHWEDAQLSTILLSNLIWTPEKVWGRIIVANIAYEKGVIVRWTGDYWTTSSDQFASYEQSSTDQSRDAFTFEIDIPEDTWAVEFAVKYSVNGMEFWENNKGNNYKIIWDNNPEELEAVDELEQSV